MDDCAVCFQLTAHRTQCGHTVCASCIRRWPRRTCPLCRALVDDSCRLLVHFFPKRFNGLIFTLSQAPSGVHFRWKHSPDRVGECDVGLLQEGDVITHINGVEVEGVESAASMFLREMVHQSIQCHVHRTSVRVQTG